MRNHSRSFFRNAEGNTTIIFALCLMSISIAAGTAIDFNRTDLARTEAYGVADSAAIAAVSLVDGSESAMKKIAKDYVLSNSKSMNVAKLEEPKFDYNSNTGEFKVTLKGEVGESLLSVVGMPKLDFQVDSTAIKPASSPVELVLALDTTGSMAGTKLTTMKSAADKMVTSILKNKQAKVGIVPFAQYVNVGVSRRHDPYLSVPNDYSTTSQSCSNSYPNKKGCTITTVNKTCTSTNDGVTTTYPCTSTTETCTSWGTAVKTCKNVTSNFTFRGCVGSRVEVARNKINGPGDKYPGFLNVNCSAEILDLTTSLTAAKGKINALSASGETYLPQGLTWGWNMLDSSHPLTTAINKATKDATGGRKVLVLMTDGANTLAPATKGATTHVAAASSVYKNVTYSNSLTAELCQAIKDDGIDLYTVQFAVTDVQLQKLLTDCASGTSKSFLASNATELVAAFDQIVADLAQVRLVR